MKTSIISLSVILGCLNLAAQDTQSPVGELAERFKQFDRNGDGKLSREEAGSAPFFEAADTDGDGVLTFAEAEAHARRSAAPARNRTAGMEGDGAGPMTSRVKPLEIPETESPIQTLDAKAADGQAVRAFWRKPTGDGPFPAIVFIHGGLTQFPEDVLRRQLLVNPVITRMLAAGYAVAQATFRTYEQDVQSRGPIEDVRAVVQALAKTPGIDAERIALFGGSGGGSIALELGGESAVRAIVAGEPATVLYTGMLTTGDYGPRLKIMAEPEKYLTPDLRARTLEKLKTLHAPVLMLHGDRHDLHKLNKPLFLPLMQEAGVRVDYREYPGYGHGFYVGGGDDRWGKGADDKVVAEVVQEVRAFLDKEMLADDTPPNAVNQPNWVTRPVRAPRVDFCTFESRAAKATVSFHIYTPDVYDREKDRRFPVVYWLHGSGGGQGGIPQLARHFEAAIEAGKTPPFLVVFVNGLVEGMYVDWKDGSVPLETVIVKDLVPHIDATWRSIATREGRMLDGFSMGGYGAARLGFKYPELFRAVSVVGAGPMQPELVQAPRAGRQRAAEVLRKVYGDDQAYFRRVSPRTLAEQNAEAIADSSLVRIVIGDKDETFGNNLAFHEHLESLKIPHAWTVLPGMAHDPMGVRNALGDDNWAFYRAAFGAVDGPAPGGAATTDAPFDRFQQLDRDGDGRLSADEVATMPSLARLLTVADADKDGGLSREEIRTASQRYPALAQLIGEKPTGDNKPIAPAASSSGRRTRIPLNTAPVDPKWGPDVEPRETTLKFKFVPDYLPGTKDANGEVLGGTELMRLAAHDGKLFAGVGYFGQDPTKRPVPGAQVLRKDSASSGWVVDATFPDYVRVDTLVTVTFTSDASGQKLAEPVTRLVAGLWWRKVKPWGTNEDEPTSVAVRDDATSKWTIRTMATATGGSPGDVRALAMHTDARTGRQYLFAGGGDGVVYRGSSDPESPGGLKWEVDPGLPKTARLVTFTECDGSLYVAGGLVENNGVSPLRGGVSADEIRREGGLFRRIDGSDSRWELVYRWPFAGPRFNEHLMRGLSVVPDPNNTAKPVILGGLEDPPLIQRIDPATGEATDELNYMKYFQRVFGDRPNKGLWVSAVMTNQLEPFTHPQTGEPMHLVTTYIMHPKDPEAPHNGAWFLVRTLDGTYEHGQIYPEGGLPSGRSLHGVRSIIESPFPEERGQVWYFAGHGAERKLLHNTAWIYKGTLKGTP